MKSFFSFILLFSALSCFGISLNRTSAESKGLDSKRLQLIDIEVEKAIADNIIPGCVIAVVKDEDLVFLKSYGNRQVYPDTIAMTDETVFDLASLTKCLSTTISFLQLEEKGLVSRKDKVKDYFPEFEPWTDSITGEKVDITIEHLMTHSSGLESYITVYEYLEKYGKGTPDTLMKVIATEADRLFRPDGNGYLYSCLNFITVQNIIQKITGMRLCDYAQKNIFDKLGLNNTCYFPDQCPDSKLPIAPTIKINDGICLQGQVHDSIALHINCGNSGNAGLFSNCEDVAVICAAIMNRGITDGKRILSGETIEKMMEMPFANGRSIGWDNSTVSASIKGDSFSSNHTICHTGYTGTSIVMDMDSRTSVITLSNRVHPVDKGSFKPLRTSISNIVASSIQQTTN